MAALEINAVVNGHRLFGLLSGAGESTVILDAGLGGTSEDWAKVQPEVANFSKVSSYSRAGLGKSEKASIPRTCKEIIEDLRSFLSSVNLNPSYILVAHSWSGSLMCGKSSAATRCDRRHLNESPRAMMAALP